MSDQLDARTRAAKAEIRAIENQLDALHHELHARVEALFPVGTRISFRKGRALITGVVIDRWRRPTEFWVRNEVTGADHQVSVGRYGAEWMYEDPR